ncbi:PIN domain-containing protein [bacterium CPR1]|nr:PIN domain-containing protein [bacterium CPR1]
MTVSKSTAIVDSNYLVALFDERDSLHDSALDVSVALEEAGVELVFLDVLMGETISVLSRRCAEQKRSKSLASILRQLNSHIPQSAVTWVGQEIRRYYSEIPADVLTTNGHRNFNDSLVALLAKGLKIGAIVSFDCDFDSLPDLARLATGSAVRTWAGRAH